MERQTNSDPKLAALLARSIGSAALAVTPAAVYDALNPKTVEAAACTTGIDIQNKSPRTQVYDVFQLDDKNERVKQLEDDRSVPASQRFVKKYDVQTSGNTVKIGIVTASDSTPDMDTQTAECNKQGVIFVTGDRNPVKSPPVRAEQAGTTTTKPETAPAKPTTPVIDLSGLNEAVTKLNQAADRIAESGPRPHFPTLPEIVMFFAGLGLMAGGEHLRRRQRDPMVPVVAAINQLNTDEATREAARVAAQTAQNTAQTTRDTAINTAMTNVADALNDFNDRLNGRMAWVKTVGIAVGTAVAAALIHEFFNGRRNRNNAEAQNQTQIRDEALREARRQAERDAELAAERARGARDAEEAAARRPFWRRFFS